jgi:release factor glutamine methyltransferase
MAALALARSNFDSLGVGARALLVRGDWGRSLDGTFDLVVSNPPYITSREIGNLEPEVRVYEPAAALDGGADGLDCYRAIFGDLGRLLAPDGAAVLELGEGQEPAVADLARRANILVNGSAVRDLGGLPRALLLGSRGYKKTLGEGREPH